MIAAQEYISQEDNEADRLIRTYLLEASEKLTKSDSEKHIGQWKLDYIIEEVKTKIYEKAQKRKEAEMKENDEREQRDQPQEATICAQTLAERVDHQSRKWGRLSKEELTTLTPMQRMQRRPTRFAVRRCLLQGVRPYGKKNYKPVAQKVKPVLGPLPAKFRQNRNITGDALEGMPELPTNPPEFEPGVRYTAERKKIIDANHDEDFLLPEEIKLMHYLMRVQEMAFAWEESEAGNFREDFFPQVEFPVIPHTPWVLKNIPIPPGIFDEVCGIIKKKIASGTYEPSNSSYRSRWFCVAKKDGKLRIVHSLEPLNAVTIAHSGVPPATYEVAAHFAGRACGGTLDLFVGYDERKIHPDSRDLTTFQTPFGAYRLVKLPMGWTNSVPIFHEDICEILREEIPEVTRPYIDDVPIRGPKTRYELEDGSYETIPENPGIRRFVWEHMQNVNRVLQRIKYCGGTFAGKKSYICCAETMVVGHRCTYEGLKPRHDKMEALTTWPSPLKTKTEVRSFLGTCGQVRQFIKDFAKIAAPIQRLTHENVPVEWGPDQEHSMDLIKDALTKAEPLKPIDYHSEGAVVLAVDTSYMAVGYYLYQRDPKDKKKKHYCLFGSITLNDREARFSQPKRELYGLKMALAASHYYTTGCRKLEVETDAKYIKGMLDNPSIAPNATINRWIEEIRKYHFTLIHIPAKSHGLADGLSRRPPGGQEPVIPKLDPEDRDGDDDGEPVNFEMGENGEKDPPLELEEFYDLIDTRGGFLYELAESEKDFEHDLQKAIDEDRDVLLMAGVNSLQFGGVSDGPDSLYAAYNTQMPIVEDEEGSWAEANPYDETHRSQNAMQLDKRVRDVYDYLTNPESTVLKGKSAKEAKRFKEVVGRYFIGKNMRMYKRNKEEEGQHQLVVLDTRKRMRMLHGAHDYLGHKGIQPTLDILERRFWWPEMESDVSWYVKSCEVCQERIHRHLKIPPTLTHTPALFQKIHVDTFQMSPASNGCKYVVHGRCALTSWSEARALKADKASAIGQWFFEDFICRWGIPKEVVTDNAGQMRKVLDWLEHKYRIDGIKISPYNSQANGKIERAHFDLRTALAKATNNDLTKWYWYLKHILWADRVTPRRGFGCSPYFLVVGADPVLPFNLEESTWLVELPDRVLTREELIGFRARALGKHKTLVESMMRRVSSEKLKELRRYEEKYKAVIKNYVFEPGTLVQIRNTAIEKSLDKKMKPRYRGPYVVIRRTLGGSYIVAEMDGTVLKEKVAAFRVIPHKLRYEPVILPEAIHKVLDATKEQLDDLEQAIDEETVESDEETYNGPDYAFYGMGKENEEYGSDEE